MLSLIISTNSPVIVNFRFHIKQNLKTQKGIKSRPVILDKVLVRVTWTYAFAFTFTMIHSKMCHEQKAEQMRHHSHRSGEQKALELAGEPKHGFERGSPNLSSAGTVGPHSHIVVQHWDLASWWSHTRESLFPYPRWSPRLLDGPPLICTHYTEGVSPRSYVLGFQARKGKQNSAETSWICCLPCSWMWVVLSASGLCSPATQNPAKSSSLHLKACHCFWKIWSHCSVSGKATKLWSCYFTSVS